MITLLTEEAVLGTILKAPHLLSDTDLQPEYFQDTENKNLYKAMRELHQQGKPVDMVILLTQTKHEKFGGAGKLNKIRNLANEEKFDSYVDVLVDDWREREKLNILEVAKHENWKLEKITTELNSLMSNKIDDRHNIKESLVKYVEAPWKPLEKPKGIHCGLDSLQKALGGFKKRKLYIIAARPAMGKTDVMLNCARHAGWHGAKPIVFSLEMGEEELIERSIATVGSFNRGVMEDLYSRLSEHQKKIWAETLKRVGETNIEIFDKPGQKISEVRAKIRKVKNENLGKDIIVFIDYLTLMKSDSDFKGNKHAEVDEITKALKGMSKEFDCPIVVLAQLNRGVEQRPNKRPLLSDLRESGSIEEDADVVMFLYRDSYYSGDENDRSLEFIIAKQRGGKTGVVTVNYNLSTGVLSDI